jgi:hypothetical protein
LALSITVAATGILCERDHIPTVNWVWTESFPRRTFWKFNYKLRFNTFKGIFTNHSRVVGSCIEM